MKKLAAYCFITFFLILGSFAAFAAEDIQTYEIGENRRAIIYVDDDNLSGPWDGSAMFPYQYIQDGIDAASDQDTVLVRAGTYRENINYNGKAITVISEDGALQTLIDGQRSGSVVSFNSDEGPDSVLEGFTIINGRAPYGGGIYCSASPVIRDNWIVANTATFGGGGISCYTYSGAWIVGNDIFANSAPSGGGIECTISNMTIEGNLIHDNQAANGGGGLTCGPGTQVSKNIIYNNSAGYGGGISCQGGIFTNNLIHGNSQGGVSCFGTLLVTMINCTISGNACGSTGAGIETLFGSNLTVVNSILWGNSGGLGEIRMGAFGAPSTLTISSSCVQGGESGIYLDTGSVMHYDAGSMIEEDPALMDPGNDDYHLSRLSPCINRGDDSLAPADDLDDDARPHMGSTDMGADEFIGLHPLSADLFALSQSAGGTVRFTLDAGLPSAGQWYIILGSRTGTAPGILLPDGLTILPVNWDSFTDYIINQLYTPVFSQFLWTLDPAGAANAELNVDPGKIPLPWVGTRLHFAYALVEPFYFTSNPIAVDVAP